MAADSVNSRKKHAFGLLRQSCIQSILIITKAEEINKKNKNVQKKVENDCKPCFYFDNPFERFLEENKRNSNVKI